MSHDARPRLIREAVALIFGSTEDEARAPFPRDLETMTPLTCLVSYEARSGLSAAMVAQYMEQLGARSGELCGDRRLRGCIVADRGEAFIFTDAGDPPDERRFTIAHELAHYALDYELPRRRAIDAFGESILSVLNGERPPTPEERIDALLAGAPLGTFAWLMERDEDGQIERAGVLVAESRADALALRLLAPDRAVLSALPRRAYGEMDRTQFDGDATTALTTLFGLPRRIAAGYARFLWPRVARPDTRAWLGLPKC